VFLNYLPKKKILLVLGDAILLSMAYLASPIIRFGVLVVAPLDDVREWLAVIVIYLFTFYIFDLYDTSARFFSAKYIFRFAIGVSAAAGTYIVIFFFFRSLSSGRSLFVITAVLASGFTYSWRLLFDLLFSGLLTRQRRLLIIGAGKSGTALYEIMKRDPNYKVIGFIDDDPKKQGGLNSPKVLGGCDALAEIASRNETDEIAIAITHLKNVKNNELLKSILDCKVRGINIYPMPSLYEEITGKIPVKHVSDLWFISTTLAGVKKGIYNLKIKRILDISFSFIGLAVCGLPLFIPVCIVIKLYSRGPIFYRQKRVGRYGSTFDLVKFRSMKIDAEKDGAVWASEKDPRVTRVGRIIRTLRIDEIPQMWNVLKGDMSFIGPRPERPEFVQILERKVPYYAVRHSVKPGITGWAQVNYPYGASKEDALEKLQYDLFYIKNLSPFLDFHILIRTIRVVLFGEGAR
jgi:sugar transferase (PEP-CTERM system associated)